MRKLSLLGLLAWHALFAIVAVKAGDDRERLQRDQASELLTQFLAAQQPAVMQGLGNWLETHALTGEQVGQLIVAAQKATSDDRRNLLWHAIRCSRSRIGREFLMKTLVDDTDEATKVRFAQSLTILAPFDVPLIAALYQSGRYAQDTSPGVREEIIKLATRDSHTSATPLSPRPAFIAESSGESAVVQLRRTHAVQAQAELLSWLAKKAATDARLVVVIEPALQALDKPHRKILAGEILAAAKEPQDRARVIPALFYAIDLFPILVSETDETVKLSIIQGLHVACSTYGRGTSSVAHGRGTLDFLCRTDPSPKVRDAARGLLERIDGVPRGGSK
jgi:hypothetical protein